MKRMLILMGLIVVAGIAVAIPKYSLWENHDAAIACFELEQVIVTEKMHMRPSVYVAIHGTASVDELMERGGC